MYLIKRFFGKIFFNLFWLPFQLFFRFFLRVEFRYEEDVKKIRLPLIIAVNHTSWVDPFLAGMVFPFNSVVYPICFAAWHIYYYVGFPFFFVLASFPVKRGIGLENALKEAVKVLKNRGTVGIFPEGKRRRFGRPRRGRRGVAYLALTTGAPVMPLKIEGALGLTFSKFFLRRKKIVVKVGKPFYLPPEMKYPENINEATDFIMDKLMSQ